MKQPTIEGYYWVLLHGRDEWEVARWCFDTTFENHWEVCGWECAVYFSEEDQWKGPLAPASP